GVPGPVEAEGAAQRAHPAVGERLEAGGALPEEVEAVEAAVGVGVEVVVGERAGEARTGREGEVGAEGGRALVVVGVLAEAVALARAVAAQSDTEAAGRRGRLHVGAAVAVAAA